MLQCALRSGVQLYTGRHVRQLIADSADHVRVVTDSGTIAARRVVVATNAFTSQLIPELKAIRPYQSQIMLTEDLESLSIRIPSEAKNWMGR